jgi:hypothetical protein
MIRSSEFGRPLADLNAPWAKRKSTGSQNRLDPSKMTRADIIFITCSLDYVVSKFSGISGEMERRVSQGRVRRHSVNLGD